MGFYTTTNPDQARDFAGKVVSRTEQGVPTLNENDNVYRTLNLYRSGEIDREETLKRLRIRKLYNQLVFASDKALGFIRFLRSEVVS